MSSNIILNNLNSTNGAGAGKAESLYDDIRRMKETGLDFHIVNVDEELSAMQNQCSHVKE